MKKLNIIIFLFFSAICIAQSISVNQDKKQDLIKSLPFPFLLLGENCESYIITTDNGKIEQYDSECKFVIYPEVKGSAKITVQNKYGKIIVEEIYNVKEIDFFLEINNGNRYIDNVEHFLKSSRLTLNSPDLVCSDFQWNCLFDLIYIQENKKSVIPIVSKNGNLSMLKENISSLKKGDILILRNIKLLIDKDEFNTPDLVLEVK
ncbi:MAG: hypothetical protein RBR78_08410 [Flavobacteriaceae bacterium]|jgi:hypothetical protein|nr:hypothetical protein [Flavobacteriaceae bacterium]